MARRTASQKPGPYAQLALDFSTRVYPLIESGYTLEEWRLTYTDHEGRCAVMATREADEGRYWFAVRSLRMVGLGQRLRLFMQAYESFPIHFGYERVRDNEYRKVVK